jgi:SAM-dependent methyltransferase
MSRGFIEHFDDPHEVVKRHVDLLKPGGYLIVSIPNKRGVNRLLAQLFNRRGLAMHNLDIMRLDTFRHLFDIPSLHTLHCGYLGVFSFRQFNTPKRSPLRFLLSFCQFIQYGLNGLYRLLFPRLGPESAWFSPYLLYIGRLQSPPASP